MLADNSKISIIIPTLNEEKALRQNLPALQSFREKGHEIILVDGGSHDKTLAVSRPFVDRLMQTVKGRAHQMNEGAGLAKHDLLLFIHADTILPGDADNILISAKETFMSLQPNSAELVWGRFNIRLDNKKLIYRLIEKSVNVRSKFTGIATGDQAIFVSRILFENIGGYDRIPLMEDVALSKKLLSYSSPLCIQETVLSSSRRWEKHGVISTILLMWRLRLFYFLGVKPEKLVESYYPDSK